MTSPDNEAASDAPTSRPQGRRRIGPSSVYTIRLDNEEIVALERLADSYELAPRALARNFIRIGLRQGGAAGRREMSELVDRLMEVSAQLRAVVPR